MKNNFIVEDCDALSRLDVFVQTKIPTLSRSHIKNLIESGLILINSKTKKAGEIVKVGDSIEVTDFEPKPLETKAENIDIDIVYQDNDVAVINKKQGMVVHPANGNETGTLVNALLFHLKNLSGINGVIRPGIVHRLDKDTSGLLLIAKNDTSHCSLAKQIQTKSCHRHYMALLSGNLKQDSGTITTHIGRNPKDRKQMAVVSDDTGKLAITDYNVVKRYGKYTLVEFVLQTGRTHQIRVHAKHMGHPVVGDELYGFNDKTFDLQGQLLHAYKIEFNQPTTNERISLSCELPDYFKSVLKKLDNTI